jgi:membrane protein
MMRWWERLPLLGRLGEVARATVFPVDLATSKRRFALIFAVRLLFLVGRRLWRDKCPRQAAALSYQTFLSLVPMLALAIAFGYALGLDAYVDRVIAFLEGQLLPETAAEIGDRIRGIAGAVRPGALGGVGGATLAVLAVMLLLTVDRAVNEIFRCSVARRIVPRIFTGLALLLLAPLAFGLSLYYTGRLFTLPRFATALLPLAFTTTALFLCYWLLPRTKVLVRHSFVAAATAGVLFEAVKLGFAIYAQHAGLALSPVYGTLVILPLFMVWVYVAWLIFLFGAELSAALHEVRRHDLFER